MPPLAASNGARDSIRQSGGAIKSSRAEKVEFFSFVDVDIDARRPERKRTTTTMPLFAASNSIRRSIFQRGCASPSLNFRLRGSRERKRACKAGSLRGSFGSYKARIKSRMHLFSRLFFSSTPRLLLPRLLLSSAIARRCAILRGVPNSAEERN